MVGLLVGWLVGCLVGLLSGCFLCWLLGSLVGCLVEGWLQIARVEVRHAPIGLRLDAVEIWRGDLPPVLKRINDYFYSDIHVACILMFILFNIPANLADDAKRAEYPAALDAFDSTAGYLYFCLFLFDLAVAWGSA